MNMKRLLIVWLLVVSGGVLAAEKVTGVGDFKIGMTEEEFLALPEVSRLKLVDVGEETRIDGSNKTTLWKTTEKSEFERWSDSSRLFGSDSREYVLSKNVGEFGYRTKLTFSEGKLIRVILFYATELFEFAKVKYGPPKLLSTFKKESCINGYGVRSQQDLGRQDYAWGVGQRVEAHYIVSSWDCGKNFGNYYTVYDKQAFLKFEKQQKIGLKEFQAERLRKEAKNSGL